MRKLDVRLWRMIKKTKGQFIAVAAVIAIGLASFVGMKMGIVNLENTVDDYYAMTNKADLQFQLMKIPETQVDRLDAVKHIQIYEPRIVLDTFLQTDDEQKVKLRVVSVAESTVLNRPYIIDGRWIKDPSKEVMLIETFARARGIKVSDMIEFTAEGKTESMVVCAIVTSSEFIYVIEDEQTLLPDFSRFGVVFLDTSFVKRAFGFGKSYNEILVQVTDESLRDKVKSELEGRLDPFGVKRVIDEDSSISDRMVHEEIAQGHKSANAIPLMFLGIAAGIMVMMISRTVKNDRLTIGILKALGYSDSQVMAHYTLYAVSIGVVGAVAGCILGVYIAGLVAEMYADLVFNLPTITGKVYPEYLVMAVILSAIFCVSAGLWGAKGVLVISPAEAMRPESPKSGKRILLEKFPLLWRRFSFTWKMVVRNLMRSKKRATFLIIGVSLTFAMTLLPIFMIDEFINMFNNQFGNFLRFDYSINFNRPISEDALYEIKELVDTEIIEPKVEVPFELQNGWRKKAVNVIGLEPDTKLYNLRDLKGRQIQLASDRIYISENLARVLDLSVGDVITVRNYIPDRQDIKLPVGGVIAQKLGSNAYMVRESMNSLLLDSDLVSGFILDSKADVKSVFSDFKNVGSVQSVKDMRSTFQQFMSMTYSSLFIMLACSFVLGFAVLYNSAIMSIHERTLEFSSLRVLGFDKKDIFKIITREYVVLSFLGIMLGIPISMGMMNLMNDAFSNEMYTFGTQITGIAFLEATGAVLLFVLVALYATYGKIQKLDFIDALKARVS